VDYLKPPLHLLYLNFFDLSNDLLGSIVSQWLPLLVNTSHYYNITSMNTDLLTEAMDLDSAPVATPNQEAKQRYLDAKRQYTLTSRKVRNLKKEASRSADARKRYQEARLARKKGQEELTKLKREAGITSKKSRKKDTATDSDAMTGVKMSSTAGIKKKTRERKPRAKQPLPKSLSRPPTRTGVYGWSVNDGDHELDRDELRAIQSKKDMRLLLPPPQMLEAERASRAERKDIQKDLALAVAAEELVENVMADKKKNHSEQAGSKAQRRNTLIMGELEGLEEEKNLSMGKVTIADLRREEVRKERVRAVAAHPPEERTVQENADIDDIAEKLGLVSMGRKRGK